MKLGIGTYAYMWSIGFDGARPEAPMRAMGLLAKARELGVRVVQFGPNLPLYELPASELEETLAACREWGLELEIGTRGVETAWLRRMLEFTANCGASLLRTVPELEGGRVPSRVELASRLGDVAPAFREAGMRLALENGLIPAAELDAALREVNSEFVGITLDTVNSLAIPEGTRQVAESLAKWTCCLHVKDFVMRREWHMMGFRVEGRPAGQGQLDTPWLLGALEAAGARCNAILELWPPEQASLSETVALEQRWAEESVRYLRNLIKE
ncbi:MAG: sugar phosphate isomerase/epimerase [Bryobacteraceae bacterium]|nr:sugar phosphate isomerase/epimerase [Bryobacteraceae bacterium]